MGACGSKLQDEKLNYVPMNWPVWPPLKQYKSTQIIKELDCPKHFLITGYIRVNIKVKYNFIAIIPNEIESLIQSFHPELNTKSITYLIDGYIRQHLNNTNSIKQYDLDCSLLIHHWISLYFSYQKSFIIDVFHRKKAHPMNKPVRHIIHLQYNNNMGEMVRKIANIYDTAPEFVLIFENMHTRVTHKVECTQLVAMTQNQWPFAVYIVNDWSKKYYYIESLKNMYNELSVSYIKICHANIDSFGRTNLFGIPIVMSYLKGMTNKQLYRIVYHRMFMWIGSNMIDHDPVCVDRRTEYIKNKHKIWDLLLKHVPFRLRKFNRGNFHWFYRPFDVNVLDIIQLNDDIFKKQFVEEYEYIVIEWNQSVVNGVKSVVNKVVVSNEYMQWRRDNKGKLDSIDVHLADYFNHFPNAKVIND